MTNKDESAPGSAVSLSVAVEHFLEAKRAQRLSDNTLIDYKRTFRRFQAFFGEDGGDPPLSSITPHEVRQFMNSLTGLSKKSVLNVHIGLSSLWHWATEEELCPENIMRKVSRPRPEIRAIQPFTHEEVDRLFNAICRSAEYTLPGKKSCSNQLQDCYRMRAILLTLIDNGLRAEELCHIRARDLSTSNIKVFGKGAKERLVPISETTYQAIMEYTEKERIGGLPGKDDFIFVTKSGSRIAGDELYHMILKLGKRAGVKAYPHKFRHTFAINFLRNGGNIFALQAILGHASLEMVKRYLSIAMADIEAVHQSASIVNCWHLGAIRVGFPASVN